MKSKIHELTKNNIIAVSKKTILLLLLAITFGCDKDDDNKTSQSLPPATQTGAGIFACTIDGKPFIDKSGGWFNCYYQFVDGGYYFGIQGNATVGMVTGVGLGTDEMQIEQGKTYILTSPTQSMSASGSVGITKNISNGTIAWTNQEFTGELYISKLDIQNFIVSGTFWFNIENPYTGETVEIREGRFDTLFTQ